MFGNELILLVEDSSDDALLFERAFTKSGLKNNVQLVRDGEQAIEYLTGTGQFGDRVKFPLPFLVMLDLKMPKIDGFEVLQWIRKHPDLKRLLVVVLTSSNLQRDVDYAYELGANSYLVKPVGLGEMVSMLSRFDAYWAEINRIPTLQKVPEPISLLSSLG